MNTATTFLARGKYVILTIPFIHQVQQNLQKELPGYTKVNKHTLPKRSCSTDTIVLPHQQ